MFTSSELVNNLCDVQIYATPGHVLIKADYSQAQMRILAHLSQDPALVKIFNDPHGDVHTEISDLLGLNYRNVAKEINFAICYGGTAWSIQGSLGCELSTAHRIVRELSAIYPEVSTYLNAVAESLDEAPVAQRHVKSLWGRRRCFYHEGPLTDREKRQAKNAVTQMLEADVFKITLLELYRQFRAENLPVQMVLLLHDGIWFSCPDKSVTVTRVTEAIQKVMENSVKLSVPLEVGLS